MRRVRECRHELRARRSWTHPDDVVEPEWRQRWRRRDAQDRTYLVQQVAASTGLSPGDAEKRVDQAIADSKTAIARSRRRDTHRSLSNQIHLFVDSHFDEAGLRLTW
jgi:hypothetical protein